MKKFMKSFLFKLLILALTLGQAFANTSDACLDALHKILSDAKSESRAITREEVMRIRDMAPLQITDEAYGATAEMIQAFYKQNYNDRNILIFTDASWKQSSGVITVMKVLEKKVKEMTGMNIVYVTPEDFPTHFTPENKTLQKIMQGTSLAYCPKDQIVDFIKKNNPVAIHLMTEGSVGIQVKNILDKAGVAYTSAYHTDWPKYASKYMPTKSLKGYVERIGYALLRKFHGKAERIMAPTETMGKILTDNKFEDAKIAKWSHGVEEYLFTPEGRDVDLFQKVLDEKLAKGELKTRTRKIEHPITLFVGRIEGEKNLDYILDMKVPGTKVFIGDGIQREVLQAKYPDAVFLGRMPYENLPKYYASADVFAFTSLTDTFGLVNLEAMATGTPVLAFNVQGPMDVVTSSKAGVLVDYLADSREQTIRNLEEGFERVVELDRKDVREFAESKPWKRSIVELLYFWHPLTAMDLEKIK